MRLLNDILETLRLKRVINAAGFMTPMGASSVRREAIESMISILDEYVDIGELQDRASEVIARVTGAEAGWITASAASGVAAMVAACMTGSHIPSIEKLPDTQGLKNEVIIQKGHDVRAGGALLSTLVRVTGAKLVYAGLANETCCYHIESAITENTAALLYVINPRISRDLLPLEVVIDVAKKYGVPVILDAAAEYDLQGFLEAGVELVVYSGHKCLLGPTSGMVAGKKERISACRLQERGICRAMKVGKEGIAGLIGALLAYEKEDREQVRKEEEETVDYWLDRLVGLSGIYCTKERDLWGNPVTRVKIRVDPKDAGLTAYHLSQELRKCDPMIIVRDNLAKTSQYIELEPCPLKDKKVESKMVADSILHILEEAQKTRDKSMTKVSYDMWR